MSRRSHGEGTIYRRADGRWEAALQVGGKRKRVYGRTRQEAARRLGELQRQAVVTGHLPDPGNRALEHLLDAWLEAKAPNLEPTTLAHYSLLCDTYLRPALGKVRLARLTAPQLQRLYSRLQAKGHHRTAQLVHCVLHQACELAVRWRWLPENPANQTVRPSYRARRKEVWTPEELGAFLEGAKSLWLAPLWIVALTSGCRLGELLALLWQDVDLAEGSFRVFKTLQRVDGHYRLGRAKTKAANRVVTLPPEGLEALWQQRTQQSEWRHAADADGQDWEEWRLIFTGRRGRPLHRAVVAHALARECERIGVPRLTPHGLRHLHASLLLQEGVPVPLVSARLGHANPAITMAVYAHVVNRGDKTAADAIGKALGRASGE